MKMAKRKDVGEKLTARCRGNAERQFKERLILLNQSPGPMQKDIAEIADECYRVTVPKGPEYRRGSRLERIASWMAYGAWMLRQNWDREDKYLICTNPPVAFIGARVLGLHYTALVYDAYPMIIGLRNARGMAGILGKWLDFALMAIQNEGLKNAETIVCITDEMSSRYKSEFPSHRDKVRTVYPWGSSTARFKKGNNSAGRKLRVTLSGNLGLTHNRDHLWKVIEEVAVSASVIICTSDSAFKWAMKKRKKANIDVSIINRLSDEEYDGLMLGSDIALVPSGLSEEDCSIPSRLFTAMRYSCAIMAVCSGRSALARIVRSNEMGYVIDPSLGQLGDIGYWLADVGENRGKLEVMQRNSYKAYTEYTRSNAELLMQYVQQSDG